MLETGHLGELSPEPAAEVPIFVGYRDFLDQMPGFCGRIFGAVNRKTVTLPDIGDASKIHGRHHQNQFGLAASLANRVIWPPSLSLTSWSPSRNSIISFSGSHLESSRIMRST